MITNSIRVEHEDDDQGAFFSSDFAVSFGTVPGRQWRPPALPSLRVTIV